VLLRVSEQRNILHEIRKRKANWVGHILRRNCLLKEVIKGQRKGQIEVTSRRGRRRKKLLDDLGDRRGYSHLEEEALDCIKWRNRFGRAVDLSTDRLLINYEPDGRWSEIRQFFTLWRDFFHFILNGVKADVTKINNKIQNSTTSTHSCGLSQDSWVLRKYHGSDDATGPEEWLCATRMRVIFRKQSHTSRSRKRYLRVF
jgi:hypothetical protein